VGLDVAADLQLLGDAGDQGRVGSQPIGLEGLAGEVGQAHEAEAELDHLSLPGEGGRRTRVSAPTIRLRGRWRHPRLR
jgi:hypothetical protein